MMLRLVVFLLMATPVAAFETVALTGSPAPGGGTFSTLGTPVLSNTGAVAFYGQVDENSRRGIWTGVPGSLQVAAESDAIAPGTADARFSDFAFSILSPSGKLAFHGFLHLSPSVTIANNTGLWAGSPSDPRLVMRDGDILPGTDFHAKPSGSALAINDDGAVAFIAEKTTTFDQFPPSTRGIWVGSPSEVALIALEGSQAPGTTNDFGRPFDRLVLNISGSVGFAAELAEVNSSENTGVWIGPTGLVELLAREGQVAPEAGGGRFVSTGTLSINASGNAALISGVVGGNSGIWIGKPESLDLLALNGMEAPGTGGATFDSFVTPLFTGGNIPAINANDQVAFLAELAPEDDLGLWRGSPGDIDLIARTGSVAPGTGGQTFQDIDLFTINSNDDVAFTATADSEGLWVNMNGRNSLVVLEGQLFDVDPTDGVDLREIEEILFEGGSGGQDGRRMSFNDRNTLLFQLDFTDGSSGIFTTTVPEPSSLLLVGICAACLLWRR